MAATQALGRRRFVLVHGWLRWGVPIALHAVHFDSVFLGEIHWLESLVTVITMPTLDGTLYGLLLWRLHHRLASRPTASR